MPRRRTSEISGDFLNREHGNDRQRPIALFCTGGIRCEKASAFLLAEGFEDVYQLDGGILKYFAGTADADNAFEGECFVFDERVSVTSSLQQGNFELCFGVQSTCVDWGQLAPIRDYLRLPGM